MSCAICLNTFTPPIKLLNCGHLFCEVCLKTVDVSRTVCCPVCRKDTVLKEAGLQDLKTVFLEVAESEQCDEGKVFEEEPSKISKCVLVFSPSCLMPFQAYSLTDDAEVTIPGLTSEAGFTNPMEFVVQKMGGKEYIYFFGKETTSVDKLDLSTGKWSQVTLSKPTTKDTKFWASSRGIIRVDGGTLVQCDMEKKEFRTHTFGDSSNNKTNVDCVREIINGPKDILFAVVLRGADNFELQILPSGELVAWQFARRLWTFTDNNTEGIYVNGYLHYSGASSKLPKANIQSVCYSPFSEHGKLSKQRHNEFLGDISFYKPLMCYHDPVKTGALLSNGQLILRNHAKSTWLWMKQIPLFQHHFCPGDEKIAIVNIPSKLLTKVQELEDKDETIALKVVDGAPASAAGEK